MRRGGWQYYHVIWAVLVFTWIANYMVRVAISPVLLPIMGEFHLSYAQAGLLATAFFYAYTALQLPAGYLGDRFGRKVLLVGAALWWGVTSVLTGLAWSFESLFAARFLMGIGQGSLFGNDRPIVVAYTPPEKMGVGQSISFLGLGLGLALGTYLAGAIAEVLPWRAVFVILAVPSLVAALLLAWVVKEPPRPLTAETRPPLRIAFGSGDLWRIYLAGIGSIYAQWVVATWAPAMFLEIGIHELSRSSLLAALMGVGAVPGLLILGPVSDRAARRQRGRKGMVALGFLLMAGVMAWMGYAVQVRAPAALLTLLVFLAGFFTWGNWGPIYALIAEITPPAILGSVYGLTNGVAFIGSLLAPAVTGKIKDLTGSFAGGCYAAAAIMIVSSALMLSVRPAFRLAPERRIQTELPV